MSFTYRDVFISATDTAHERLASTHTPQAVQRAVSTTMNMIITLTHDLCARYHWDLTTPRISLRTDKDNKSAKNSNSTPYIRLSCIIPGVKLWITMYDTSMTVDFYETVTKTSHRNFSGNYTQLFQALCHSIDKSQNISAA